MENDSPNRIDWIDITKFLAILNIIIFHSQLLPFQEKLNPFLKPWMITIFPLLGGILISKRNDRNILTSIVNRMKSLLLPYFIFGIISYLFWLILRIDFPFGDVRNNWYEQLSRFVLGESVVFNGPLWFLIPYFFAAIIAELIKIPSYKSHPYILSLLSFTCIYFGMNISPNSWGIPLHVDIALIFIGFFIAGFMYTHLFRLIQNSYILFLVAILFTILCFINGSVDIFSRTYNNKLIFGITGVLGSLLCIKTGIALIHTNHTFTHTLSKLGKESLTLMLVHWPIMQWITLLFHYSGILSYFKVNVSYVSFTSASTSTFTQTFFFLSFIIYTLTPIFLVYLKQKFFASKK